MLRVQSIRRNPARVLALLGVTTAIGALTLVGSADSANAQGVLGTQWAESEVGWTGRWRRRGRSNVFDAAWTHPRHTVVRAILRMRVTGNVVTIIRRDTFGPGLGRGCRYRGVIRGNFVSGTYSCDWARGPFRWTARIYGQSQGGSGGNAVRICRNYASAAVNHQRANVARRCGYRGARWHGGYANHYNWCIRSPQHARNREHNARLVSLRRCTGGGNAAAYCRNYARAAVNHQRANVARGCGYRGSRWQANYGNHYNWCIRSPQHARNREHNARVVSLRRCTGQGAVRQICRNYASAAINHQRANMARRCGFRGARWQNNYANHYNWCVRTSQNARNHEHRQRVAALGRCGGGGAIRRFNYPRVNGSILDHCWVWAQNCGWTAAHWYCRSRGYRRATAFGRYRPGRTYVVGSRRVCQGSFCVGYNSITCRR